MDTQSTNLSETETKNIDDSIPTKSLSDSIPIYLRISMDN